MAVASEIAASSGMPTGWERDLCVLYSAATASRASVLPLGGTEASTDIESRYFPANPAGTQGTAVTIGEVITAAQAAMFENEDGDFAPTLQAALSGVGVEDGAAFSDERIAAYTAAELAVRRKFGSSVLQLAQSAGLDRVLPADIVGPLIQRDLVKTATEGGGEFRRRDGGWAILQTSEGPLLLAFDPDSSTERPEFGGVMLDRLNAARGEELRALITELHREQARAQLMRQVERQLASHAMALPARIPETVRRLAAIEDREQAIREQEALGTYLDVLLRSGNSRLRQQTWRFINQSLNPVETNSRETTFATFLLAHIANCPAESEERRGQAARQLEVIEALRAVDDAATRQAPSETAAAVIPHIADPTQATIRSPESLVSIRTAYNTRAQAMNCLDGLTDLPVPEQVWEHLRDQWTDQYRTLVAFREWLNGGHEAEPEPDTLDVILQRAAAEVNRDLERGEVSMDEVWSRIRGQLSRRLPSGVDPFPGVVPFTEGGVMITNPNVEALLPTLVLATALQQYCGDGGSDREQIRRYWTLHLAWLDDYNQSLTRSEQTLVTTEERVAAHQRFMTDSGITQDDIGHAIEIAQPAQASAAPREGHVAVRAAIFDPLFAALALHRRGQINLASPVFQEFFRDFVGEPNLDLSPLVL